jgi:hypothetical protein
MRDAALRMAVGPWDTGCKKVTLASLFTIGKKFRFM